MYPGVSLSTPSTHLKYFSCTLSTSSCSFHPQISAPYISTLSTMLSNIIILLPNSPPHFLSDSANTSNYLGRLPHYLSHLRLVRGVAQVPELAHSFYLAFFPLPLALITLPLYLLEHHHSRLLNIHFQLFLPHILSQVPHHFFHLSLTLCHNHHVVRKRQAPNFLLAHQTPPPPCSFLNISSTAAIYIVNSIGLRGQPCLTPFVVSHHLPSFTPTFTLPFVLTYTTSTSLSFPLSYTRPEVYEQCAHPPLFLLQFTFC
jgi:hypothetical protein